MELLFIDMPESEKPLKCTVQKTGFLGFTAATSEELKLTKENSIKFAVDRNGKNDPKSDLYMIINEGYESGSSKMKQTGVYLSCNTKVLFEKIGLDYNSKDKTYIYDIYKTDDLYEGKIIYKLKFREIVKEKRNKKADI